MIYRYIVAFLQVIRVEVEARELSEGIEIQESRQQAREPVTKKSISHTAATLLTKGTTRNIECIVKGNIIQLVVGRSRMGLEEGNYSGERKDTFYPSVVVTMPVIVVVIGVVGTVEGDTINHFVNRTVVVKEMIKKCSNSTPTTCSWQHTSTAW